MAHKTPQKTGSKIGLLQKITNFLLGFVLSFFIFLLSLKLFGSLPAWIGGGIGALISLGAAIYTLKKYENQPAKRIVGIGILCSVLAIIALPLILWLMALSLFQGVAN